MNAINAKLWIVKNFPTQGAEWQKITGKAAQNNGHVYKNNQKNTKSVEKYEKSRKPDEIRHKNIHNRQFVLRTCCAVVRGSIIRQ
ncbi:MAG: hypothetical protein FWF33_06160 [Clostridiales bacterium]|nr:hypothetical protein [Clostridiales bacterium]